MTKYVAFFRGINVGGNSKLSMEIIKNEFKKLGFENILTFLNSGNVVFDSNQQEIEEISTTITDRIRFVAGRELLVIVRRYDYLQDLLHLFTGNIKRGNVQEKYLVAFLYEPMIAKQKETCLASRCDRYQITIVSSTEAFCTYYLSPQFSTVDMIAMLEVCFGRKITTRTWNTVAKIAKAN